MKIKLAFTVSKVKCLILLGVIYFGVPAKTMAQASWVDSIDVYGREVLMPAERYKWDWGQATMLNSYVHLYNAVPQKKKRVYLEYVKKAMNSTYDSANGLHPNAVASGHGMVFLAKITNEQRFADKANKIYQDYLSIPKTKSGGVSHRTETVELWDDTVYMLSMYLLEMYRWTGDEKYLEEFVSQLLIHKDKLSDKKTGLWVHGYDDDEVNYFDRCSMKNWADLSPKRRNVEFWGRGNGWIVMAIADALKVAPKNSCYYNILAKELNAITRKLPKLQDSVTGMWRQLPIHANDKKNFLESSCSAMFGYGMAVGVRLGVLDSEIFLPVVERTYAGLRKYAMRQEGRYLLPTQVCKGTCVGDKDYYYNRQIGEGINYAVGAYLMFGLAYDELKNNY